MKLSKWITYAIPLFVSMILGGCNACTEQHDPYEDLKRFENERKVGNQPTPQLNKDGSYPEAAKAESKSDAPAAVAANANPAAAKYQMFCASCHGVEGAADGAAAAAMNPKPRNLTLASWQESVDDEKIYKVIKEGGPAVGLSATMAPWGAVLNEEELQGMVKLVRSFKK